VTETGKDGAGGPEGGSGGGPDDRQVGGAQASRPGGGGGAGAAGRASPLAEVLAPPDPVHEPFVDLAREAGARLHDASRARRRWAAWLMLAVAIVSGASGTTSLAASAGLTRLGPTIAVVLCYLVCFVALTRALRVIPLSVAYAVWSGIGIMLVSAIGWVVFDQRLNPVEWVGVALIVAGVVLIQLKSRVGRGD